MFHSFQLKKRLMYGGSLQVVIPCLLSLLTYILLTPNVVSEISVAAALNSAADLKLPVRIAALILLGALSYTFLAPRSFPPRRWAQTLLSYMTHSRHFLSGKRFTKNGSSREAQLAQKRGGEVGGLTNEGNTCFMNSVIQSLASSHSLLLFIDDNVYEIVEAPDGSLVKTNTLKRNMTFTAALKSLLDDLNGSYVLRGKEFSTRLLMKKMADGPKQNFFMGYNQEDAQEFYQLVMRKVEKEHKKSCSDSSRAASREASVEPEDVNSTSKYVSIDSVPNHISGCAQIGHLGKVYVPAHQINPNIADSSKQLFPMDLVTPVDGIAAERIGCVNCGETGGIRYSVISGLSLNLPYEQGFGSRYDLVLLLQQWEKPEIIDEVNCNRCGLSQTKQFLLENADSSSSEKLVANFEKRIAEIEEELKMDSISDEVFEKLTVKQMTRKTLKSKQILLSRPPPLLCIHINRSVIDPRTFMIVKNPKNLSFPAELDLNPFVAVPEEINMDARLPFKKREETVEEGLDEQKEEEEKGEEMDETENANELMNSLELEEKKSNGSKSKPVDSPILNKDLLYNLNAVITHMGTHHYGHYICYRKWRGTWWRVNDEIVTATTENEVLRAPGTFMLFYEHKSADKSYEESEEELPVSSADEFQVSEDDAVLLSSEDENSDLEELFRGESDTAEKLFPNATTFEVEEERAMN